MRVRLPRLVIAGLSGDSGKTVVSLSILSALRSRGLSVSVFKKGPDYIDSAWLGAVGEAECRNLDTYLVEPKVVSRRFVSSAAGSDFALIEGNRGIFDGKDVEGTHSTAGLAKLLQAPVVLVVNGAKVTRTLAAIVNGCRSFDGDLEMAGVIVNRIAGERHREIVMRSIMSYCDVPLLGALPKLGDDSSIIPSRHLGLVTPFEFAGGAGIRERFAEIGNRFIDIDRIIDIANGAVDLESSAGEEVIAPDVKVRLGYFSDSVFTFYYPENLEALRLSGAEMIRISSLRDNELPDIDGLYIGGGFPETHARDLAANDSMLRSVKLAAEAGMPVYAECGGLIYLCRSIEWQGNTYPMAGVFPVDLVMNERPVGHGYTLCEIDSPNPFFSQGTTLKGHEFHYSSPASLPGDLKTCMNMRLGTGLGQGRDAMVRGSTLACYTHIHADGVTVWADAIVRSADEYRAAQREKNGSKPGSREEQGNDESGGLNQDSYGRGCGGRAGEICCQSQDSCVYWEVVA